MVVFFYFVLLGYALRRSHAALTATMTINTEGDPGPPPSPITAIVLNPTRFRRHGQGSSAQFVAEYGTVEVTGKVPTDPTDPTTPSLYENIKSWAKEAHEGNDAPRRCLLQMMDPIMGNEVLREFNLIDTFPLRFEILNVETGGGEDILMWKLEMKPIRVEHARRRRLHATMRSLPTGSDEEGLFWLTYRYDDGGVEIETFNSMVGFGGHSGARETNGGRLEWNSLTLKGVVEKERTQMLTWYSAMTEKGSNSDGDGYRDISITVLNPMGTTPDVLAVDFNECFLSSYSMTLECGDECEAVETVEITVGYSENFS